MLSTYSTTQSVAYLANLHFATSREHVAWLFGELAERYGLSGMSVQRFTMKGTDLLEPHCLNLGRFLTLQPEYLGRRLYTADPLVTTALRASEDISWNLDSRFLRNSELGKQFERLGVHSGVSAAVESSGSQGSEAHPSVCVAAHLAFDGAWLDTESRQIMSLLMPYLLRIGNRDWISAGPSISRRQLDILQLLHKGFSPRQTAAKLHLPSRTVNFHLKRLCQELEVSDWRDALSIMAQQALFD